MAYKKKKKPIVSVSIQSLSAYELSRWASLIEAVEIIGDKCDEKGIDFNVIDLKPLDIRNFVDKYSDVVYQHNFMHIPSNPVQLP